MVHMRNYRHVTDVGLLVHDGTDLVYGKIHLKTSYSIRPRVTFGQYNTQESWGIFIPTYQQELCFPSHNNKTQYYFLKILIIATKA